MERIKLKSRYALSDCGLLFSCALTFLEPGAVRGDNSRTEVY